MEVAQKKCPSCGKEVRLGKSPKDRVPKCKTNLTDQKNVIDGRVVTLFCIYIYVVGYYGFLSTFDSCKFKFQINKYPGKTKFKAIEIKIQ